MSVNQTEICDFSFPGDGENAATAQSRDFRTLNEIAHKFLLQASANFALGVTTTETMMRGAQDTHQSSESYKSALMLARGASFCGSSS